ncbi:MAG TPA: universal stress protein [Acidobacteriaceae bacterium]|nr:universal stress protein [Acidobacteriaceae bacterium]
MYKKIVVALDESNEAKHAVATAIALAKQLGSELRILTVSEPLPIYAAFMDSELPGARQKLLEERNSFYADLQKESIKQASDAGIKVDAAIIEGQEVQAIANHITAFGADLLVIGRRHHSAMSGIWGGTVHNVAEKVCCSILAVC